VLALHVLKQGESLAECAQRVLHAGLPVRLRRGEFGFEQSANGFGDVLRDSENSFRNVGFHLQCFECFAERFTSLSRFGGR